MSPGVSRLWCIAAIEDGTLLLSFSPALGVVLQSCIMTPGCMGCISLVTIVVDELWPHHPWVDLGGNKDLLLLQLRHLRVLREVTLTSVAHILRQHRVVLAHLLAMALTVLETSRRVSSCDVLNHLVVLVAEKIALRQSWLICISSLTL